MTRQLFRPTQGTSAALAMLFLVTLSACDRSDMPPLQISPGTGLGMGEAPADPPAGSHLGSDTQEPTEPHAAPHGTAHDPVEEVPFEPTRHFRDSGPPTATLFFIASMRGYTEPCGCTAGLLVGGLDRIVGFVREAMATQPEAVMIDAGNLLFEHEVLEEHLHEQELMKAQVLLRAHNVLGTVSTTPGATDFALGLDAYLELVAASDMRILVANLAATDGRSLSWQPTHTLTINGARVGLVGAVDPVGFAHISDELVASDPVVAISEAAMALRGDGVGGVVLVFQGTLEALRGVLALLPEGTVDFAIVGDHPAETDEVVFERGTAILQAYDQGRFVGILKLYQQPSDGSDEGSHGFVSARVEDREAIDRIDRRLDYLRGQLALLPLTTEGEEPAIVRTMREEVLELEVEREAARNLAVAVDPTQNSFLYWPEAMVPGYPLDADVAADMRRFNHALAALHAGRTEIVPLGPDDVAYVGVEMCAVCHIEEHTFWQTTQHSDAIATLVDREKEFDENCVGCHVTGFRAPGGAVTGNHNGLSNVQCESCHGPGGDHVGAPSSGLLTAQPQVDACMLCHVPAHSPDFDFDLYRHEIIGGGHGPHE